MIRMRARYWVCRRKILSRTPLENPATRKPDYIWQLVAASERIGFTPLMVAVCGRWWFWAQALTPSGFAIPITTFRCSKLTIRRPKFGSESYQDSSRPVNVRAAPRQLMPMAIAANDAARSRRQGRQPEGAEQQRGEHRVMLDRRRQQSVSTRRRGSTATRTPIAACAVRRACSLAQRTP